MLGFEPGCDIFFFYYNSLLEDIAEDYNFAPKQLLWVPQIRFETTRK